MRLQFDDGERELMLARLGLANDATDDDLAAAVGQWVQEERQPDPEPDPDPDPNDIDASQGDVVVIDVASFNRLRQRDRVAGQVEAQMHLRDRNEFVEEAIADGKFSPSRREHYRQRYDSDPEGTRALIGRLQPNTVPLEARGHDEPTDEAEQSDAYPKEWAPDVAARAESIQTGQGAGGMPGAPGRRNRVHGEG